MQFGYVTRISKKERSNGEYTPIADMASRASLCVIVELLYINEMKLCHQNLAVSSKFGSALQLFVFNVLMATKANDNQNLAPFCCSLRQNFESSNRCSLIE